MAWLVMLLICVLATQCSTATAFFDWMKRPDAPPAPTPVPSLPKGDTPPFEMTVVEEKFLAEARLMELSPLDSCNYRVMNTILVE